MATRAPFSGGGEESTKQPAEPTATEVRAKGIYDSVQAFQLISTTCLTACVWHTTM